MCNTAYDYKKKHSVNIHVHKKFDFFYKLICLGRPVFINVKKCT